MRRYQPFKAKIQWTLCHSRSFWPDLGVAYAKAQDRFASTCLSLSPSPTPLVAVPSQTRKGRCSSQQPIPLQDLPDTHVCVRGGQWDSQLAVQAELRSKKPPSTQDNVPHFSGLLPDPQQVSGTCRRKYSQGSACLGIVRMCFAVKGGGVSGGGSCQFENKNLDFDTNSPNLSPNVSVRKRVFSQGKLSDEKPHPRQFQGSWAYRQSIYTSETQRFLSACIEEDPFCPAQTLVGAMRSHKREEGVRQRSVSAQHLWRYGGPIRRLTCLGRPRQG